jgi:hypothetical protein
MTRSFRIPHNRSSHEGDVIHIQNVPARNCTLGIEGICGVRGKLDALFSLTLSADEWPAPWQPSPVRQSRVQVGPIAGVDTLTRETPLSLSRIEHQFFDHPACSLVIILRKLRGFSVWWY